MAFSVMLVTSFALIYFSPTVQTILPVGGDSRKQTSMIFVVAVIGCGIFTIYASSLFFKQKSREIGIFMALGARKRQLSNMLFRDVCTIGLVGGIGGLLIAVPVSRGIWAMFQAMLKDSREMVWQFSAVGFNIGILFAFFMLLVFKSNDGVINVDEIRALMADMVIIGVILLYISVIYYITFRKFIKTVGISDKI